MTRPLAALMLAVLMVAASGPTLAGDTERQGRISHVGAGFDRDYLALPCRTPANVHCGLVVRLCGSAACRVMRQTDWGPSQRLHPNRIADVAPSTFAVLCGESPSVGTCPGHWEVVDERLPETDMVP